MEIIKTKEPGPVYGYAVLQGNSWFVFYENYDLPFQAKRKPRGQICFSSDIPEDVALAIETFLGN